MLRKFGVIVTAFVLAFALVGCGQAQTPDEAATPTPSTESPSTEQPSGEATDGEQLVQTKCSMCHDLSRVEAAVYDEAGWDATITRMQQNGLVVTDPERQAILDYLVARDAGR